MARPEGALCNSRDREVVVTLLKMIKEVRRTGTRFILSFTKEERLCRLMCGKALPFRDDAF